MSSSPWIVCGLSLLAACGYVKDGNLPDAGPAPDPADTTAPRLTSSTPAADATRVSVLGKLTFTFDEALDPATVTPTSVVVTSPQLGVPSRIGGTVTYDDATRTVTFTPAAPLERGVPYTARVGNTITDAAGNAFAGAEQSFLTSVNSLAKLTAYDTVEDLGLIQWIQFVLDANGRPSKYLAYFGPGSDGIWFTADDMVGGRYDTTDAADGRHLEQRAYTPGADGRWNTADDTMSALIAWTYDGQRRLIERTRATGAGPDAQWGTADDSLTFLETYAYAASQARITRFTGPGNDNAWRTLDDRADGYTVYTFDENGLLTRVTSYSAGPDGRAQTADDTCTGYIDHEYTGALLREYTIGHSAGPDGVLLTADDGYSFLAKYAYDARGAQVGFLQFSGPGVDGVWRTPDDLISARGAQVADGNGLVTQVRSYVGPGPDALWNTADDVIESLRSGTFDAAGNRLEERYFLGPGADGVWGTADDRLDSVSQFDPSH